MIFKDKQKNKSEHTLEEIKKGIEKVNKRMSVTVDKMPLLESSYSHAVNEIKYLFNWSMAILGIVFALYNNYQTTLELNVVEIFFLKYSFFVLSTSLVLSGVSMIIKTKIISDVPIVTFDIVNAKIDEESYLTENIENKMSSLAEVQDVLTVMENRGIVSSYIDFCNYIIFFIGFVSFILSAFFIFIRV